MSTRHIAAEHAEARDLTPHGSGGGALKRFRRRLAADGFTTDEGWRPRPGYLYTVVRAISARVNQNYDGWPSEELKKSYKTFIGKPVFVNHENHDPTKARGVVVAARYVENGMDKYVETVMEVDAGRFPKLAHEIKTGGLDSVSMGAEAGFTICSYCRNKATDLDDMCDHVRHHKGKTLTRFDKRTGKKEDVLVFESCHKISFFELSYVFEPADETAVASKVVVAGKKTASPDDDIPAWPHDLIHHLSEPTGYSAGYAAHSHPAFRDPEDDSYGREYEDLEGSYHAAGGTGPDFEEGVTDAANGISHKLDEPEAYHAYQAEEQAWRKRNRDSVYQQKQDKHNRLRERGKPIFRLDNEPEMPKGLGFGIDRGVTTWEPDHENHPEGSWEGCPTCSDDGYGPKPVNYSDPDDNIDPFDPRIIGASRRTAEDLAIPAPPGTPTIDQSVIDNTPVIELNPATELTGQEAPGVPKQGAFDADIAEITKLAADCPPGMDCSRNMAVGLEQIGKDTPNNPVNQVSSDPNGVGYTPDSLGQPGGSADGDGILPGSRALYDDLMKEFPGSDIGGYRVDDFHEHDRGALDFMTTDDAQAAKVREKAFGAGAPYVLWKQQQWNSDGTVSGMEDRGNPTQNHFDHVHIAPLSTPPPTTTAQPKSTGVQQTQRAAGKYTKEDFAAAGSRKPWETDKPKREPVPEEDVTEAREIAAMILVAELVDNSGKTQRSNTLSTYKKVHQFFDQIGAPNEGGADGVLDYGSGLGHSGRWGHTYEPNPDKIAPKPGDPTDAGIPGAGTYPDWIDDEEIPPGKFNRITNLHVLNVVPPEMRERIIKGIGTALAPGGHAVIITRSKRDVDSTVNKEEVGPSDPGAWYMGDPKRPDERTYQRGFTSDELTKLVGGHLGDGYSVNPISMGSVAAIHVIKNPAAKTMPTARRQVRSAALKKIARNRAVKLAYGEIEAPAMVDTLREEGSAPEDDNNDFERYVDPPQELQTPDLSQGAQIDRREEIAEGLGADQMGAPGAAEAAPVEDQGNYITLKIPMPQQAPQVPQQAAPPMMGPPPQQMVAALDYFDRYYGRRIANWMDAIEAKRDFTPEEAADYRRQLARLSTLENRRELSTTNRNPQKGTANMARSNSIASRNKVATAGRRQHFAEGPLVDGGDRSRNDQGEQEEAFISQTPEFVEVDFPDDDTPNISNTEHNLVAKVQRGRDQLMRDASQLAKMRQRRAFDEAGGPVATTVDPTVNAGAEAEALTGTDFESANPNDGVTPTNPKDASLRAFQAFDGWLSAKTGKSSRRHSEATIKRAAAEFSRQAGISPQALFPALGIVLREARKADKQANTKGARMRKRADEKLEVAAPDGRIDVEAPVSDTTDAEAQASQFDLHDFGNNAGDNIAKPDLSTDQNWAPGEAKTSARVKTAGGLLAMRCAEGMIAAGLEPDSRERKYQLAAEFEHMNRGLIQDRVALLERFAAVRQADRRKVASGSSRGAARSPIPAGLGGGTRTASAGQRLAAHDPSNDSTLFI